MMCQLVYFLAALSKSVAAAEQLDMYLAVVNPPFQTVGSSSFEFLICEDIDAKAIDYENCCVDNKVKLTKHDCLVILNEN